MFLLRTSFLFRNQIEIERDGNPRPILKVRRHHMDQISREDEHSAINRRFRKRGWPPILRAQGQGIEKNNVSILVRPGPFGRLVIEVDVAHTGPVRGEVGMGHIPIAGLVDNYPATRHDDICVLRNVTGVTNTLDTSLSYEP